MKTTLVSDYGRLAGEVAEALRCAEITEVEIRTDSTAQFALRHAPDVDSATLDRIMRMIRPLVPEIEVDESLSDGDVALHLGDAKPLSEWRVKVFSDSAALRKTLRGELRELGFAKCRTEDETQMSDRLQFGGASPFARGVLMWRLARDGAQPIEVEEWGKDDPDIFVRLVDPALRHLTPSERVVVEVRADDPEAAIAATELLQSAGFPRFDVKLPGGGRRAACGSTLEVDAGPLAKFGHDMELARLMVVADQVAARSGIDPKRYPVRANRTNAAKPILYLPVKACRDGRLPPYAGAFPERFQVSLQTDDRRHGDALTAAFKEQGFNRVTRRMLDDVTTGFAIWFGAAGSEPTVLETARLTVEAHMRDIGAEAVSLALVGKLPSDSTDIIVRAPSAAFVDGSLAREIENPVLYNVLIGGGATATVAAIARALKSLGFASVETRGGRPDTGPRLSYGAAPRPLMDRIRATVHDTSSILLPLVKERSVTDRDIWLILPEQPGVADNRLPPPPPRSSATVPFKSRGANGRAFLRIEPHFVEIGGRRMTRRLDNPPIHVPRLERFSPLCVDAVTAESISHVFSAVDLREPCALEGPTGAFKTGLVMYCAALINQPLFRLNLNGQTDTGELIGRYVPADGGTWRFQEGLLVTAMRQGYWILLDELNLAEASVLERLNSVLERYPTLVLSEHDSSVIDAPHRDFCVFATFNPAGAYVGREAMSPALRDRLVAYRFVPRPGENEYLALARLAVYGAQPAITVHGEKFDGYADTAVFGNLAQVGRAGDFLEGLARFQVSVEAAAEPDESGSCRLGADRHDRYIFTRRGFVNALHYVDREIENDHRSRLAVTAGWRAIERYYLNRLATQADRNTVIELAQAAGITPGSWRKAA